MEKTLRQQDYSIIHKLIQQPESFDFFQAIRLLLLQEYRLEDIEFKSNPEFYFAKSAIHSISKSEERLIITQSFLGLTGQSGVLPDHLTQVLQKSIDEKDLALKDLLAIFENKLLYLFYKSYEAASFYRSYETNPNSLKDDASLSLIAAITGQPQHALKHQNISSDILIYYAGLLAKNTRSKLGLKSILHDYFQLPISIEEFSGEWITINQDELTKLDASKQYNCLGIDSIMGKEVWHIQNSFTIIIGPLDYQQFLKLLPNTTMLNTLKDLVEFYVGLEFNFKLKLLLKPESVPYCQLRQINPYCLGLNSWLKTKTQPKTTVAVSLNLA